jgi:hypothetical protein
MRKETGKEQQQAGGGSHAGQQAARQKRAASDALAAAFGGISILTAILGTAILFFTEQVPSPFACVH